MMSTAQIMLMWAALLAVMLACRCILLVMLQGRVLPPRVERAVGSIPVAAFTALVANDLIQPDTWGQGPRGVLVSLVSAGIVLLVARKTGSLIWCAVVGMGVYALASLL